ncbi:leucyl aminopeptidase family protein [Dyella sedimenti]|uniref:leucyl aminopeptidase family protein n=1 Tax=Dyella sedimenti TaxID=2919947 RepID=UPI001FAB2791|nr:leucyl aminopeptidase family protein [Dyella sedimenti]
MSALIERKTGDRHSIAIETTDAAHYTATKRRLTAAQRRWLGDSGFEAAPGTFALLADEGGKLVRVLAGVDAGDALGALGALPRTLPEATYHLADEGVLRDVRQAALGWALGAYEFTRYRKPRRAPARLAIAAADLAELAPLVEATTLVRDLVNTPTEDMGPKQLAEAVKQLGKAHKAKVREWVGDELLEANFPTIHAVGRGSHRAPRLVELTWGKAGDPKLSLIGKGVCFDTGGLDLKPADGMRWMKKDMGGAAHAIALAGLVMQARLPVRLQLLIPAVENAVSGAAMRPGEVIVTRAGLSVEVDNTDAEGRLVLCDALAYASEQQPELIVDFATLTGAARIALGPDLPALFANRDDIAEQVLTAGRAASDSLWRLPLWRPYRKMLESYLADLANSGTSRHAGAITAALYLERFVPEATPWMHLDTYAWNDADRPGRPRGGEALGLRAFFAFLRGRYKR